MRKSPKILEYESIVETLTPSVFRQAFRMLGDEESARDAVQDVFLRVFQGLDRFRGASEVSTWVYRITFNVCASMRSKMKPVSPLPSCEKAEALESADPTPDELLDDEVRREHLIRLISRLPPKEAAAITLFYAEGKSYKEIGEILEIPDGSVATLLHNARERLRHQLEEWR